MPSPATFEDRSPLDWSWKLADIARGDAVTAHAAVTAAVMAFRDWADLGPQGRAAHLHRLAEVADAAIVNAGAWTHYSWAVRDALEFSGVPAVEVHISDVSAREDWRKTSVFDGLVIGRVFGKKEEGYREALQLIARELGVGAP